MAAKVEALWAKPLAESTSVDLVSIRASRSAFSASADTLLPPARECFLDKCVYLLRNKQALDSVGSFSSLLASPAERKKYPRERMQSTTRAALSEKVKKGS